MRARALYLACSATVIVLSAVTATHRPRCQKECFCDSFGRLRRYQRILGAREADENEFPFLVLLTDYLTTCGGAIVTKRHILTAAHCVDLLHLPSTVAELGMHNQSKPVRTMKVTSVKSHPDYNSRDGNGADVAVATVGIDIVFCVAVQAACLPATGVFMYKTGKEVEVAGWGSASLEETPEDALRKVTMSIVNQEKCNEGYRKENVSITDDMICAGSGTGDNGTYVGDNGGPLMRTRSVTDKRVVIGIASFTRPELPGVFTRVASFMSWIEEQLGNECVCSEKNYGGRQKQPHIQE